MGLWTARSIYIQAAFLQKRPWHSFSAALCKAVPCKVENVCSELMERVVELPMPLLLRNDIKHNALPALTTLSWPLSAPLVVCLQVITNIWKLNSNSCVVNGFFQTHSPTISQMPFSQDKQLLDYSSMITTSHRHTLANSKTKALLFTHGTVVTLPLFFSQS